MEVQNMPEEPPEFYRYSVSLVKQGSHQFYTLTVPSDVLARTCCVITRDEDPQVGFQRLLDRKRAEEIADYIDNQHGTIPNAIVLSAQPEAEAKVIGRGKTLQFRNNQRAFLILDGQHRVYGFSKAKTHLRVPVVIYNNLTRKDESRLFIDINTKQRPVPNELLLDIKRLAEYESDTEQLLREVFDLYHAEPGSPLLGLLSPAAKESAKISRTTFNAGFKPILDVFTAPEAEQIYTATAAFLTAFIAGLRSQSCAPAITNPIAFRAILAFFPEVARRVSDRYGKAYSADNFSSVLTPQLFKKIKPVIVRPGTSVKSLLKTLSAQFKSDFTL